MSEENTDLERLVDEVRDAQAGARRGRQEGVYAESLVELHAALATLLSSRLRRALGTDFMRRGEVGGAPNYARGEQTYEAMLFFRTNGRDYRLLLVEPDDEPPTLVVVETMRSSSYLHRGEWEAKVNCDGDLLRFLARIPKETA